MTEHTPTPWEVERCQSGDMEMQGVRGANGRIVIADLLRDGQDDIDYAFIVRAVNCHEELVKALERVMNNCVECGEEDEPCVDCECARAALAKAKEEAPA